MIDKSDMVIIFGSPKNKLYAAECAKSRKIKVKYNKIDFSTKKFVP